LYSVGRSLRSILVRECGDVNVTLPYPDYIANLERETAADGQFGWGGTPLKRYQGPSKLSSSGSQQMLEIMIKNQGSL